MMRDFFERSENDPDLLDDCEKLVKLCYSGNPQLRKEWLNAIKQKRIELNKFDFFLVLMVTVLLLNIVAMISMSMI